MANMCMHTFDRTAMLKPAFTELVSKLRLLNPQQLAQLGVELEHAQRGVEAILALDTRCNDNIE